MGIEALHDTQQQDLEIKMSRGIVGIAIQLLQPATIE